MRITGEQNEASAVALDDVYILLDGVGDPEIPVRLLASAKATARRISG